jgi:hypothetical protein
LGEAHTDLIWLFDGNEISHSVKDGEFFGRDVQILAPEAGLSHEVICKIQCV